MITRAFHVKRFRRMLVDLNIDPASLVRDADGAIRDESLLKALTPPLGNQTLAEGLISAVKLAAAEPETGP